MAFNTDKAALLSLEISRLNKELREIKKEYKDLFKDVCEHDLESGVEVNQVYSKGSVEVRWERCKICGLVWKYGESLEGTLSKGSSRESREYKYLDKEITSFTFFLSHETGTGRSR